MKLIIEKAKLSDTPENILRRAGYGYIHSRATDHGSYVRRLTRDHYPRLHLYVSYSGEKAVFDLHLDQKQASYQGSRMHNGEHEGPVVEEEIGRIREVAEDLRDKPTEEITIKKRWWQIF